MAGYLTTHVLDTARGAPARGMEIRLFRLEGQGRHLIATRITDADGRTDGPILPPDAFAPGRYELEFHAGAWMDASGIAPGSPRFLDVIPVRFGIAGDGHYHVPLLISPFGYSTYRGS